MSQLRGWSMESNKHLSAIWGPDYNHLLILSFIVVYLFKEIVIKN